MTPFGHLSTHGTCTTTDNKAPQHLERRFCHKGKSTFGPFVLDQTMNAHFLSPLQWLILLYGSTWKPFHPWKSPYHVPQGSSIPGKTVLPWTPVSILAVLQDHTMNTHFLSPDQWQVLLIDSILKPSTYGRRSTTDHKFLQYLENHYYHE